MRAAASASSWPRTVGVPPRTISKWGATCQPVMWTNCCADAIASAIAAIASSPSISTSSRQPSRGGGPPFAHTLAASGCNARDHPSRRSRHACLARTVASTPAPIVSSTLDISASGICGIARRDAQPETQVRSVEHRLVCRRTERPCGPSSASALIGGIIGRDGEEVFARRCERSPPASASRRPAPPITKASTGGAGADCSELGRS